jgi:hypothetical protein
LLWPERVSVKLAMRLSGMVSFAESPKNNSLQQTKQNNNKLDRKE